MLSIEERFSMAMHNAARTWRQALDRRLRHLGMGQASWLAIATIAKSGNVPPSQAELAAKLGVEAPTMVSMIDRLVRSGYVLRQPSETDRRVKQVVLTEDGQKIYTSVKAEANALRHELLRGLDRQRLADAADVLEAVIAAAEAEA
ncbi:MarR family transcriptional regulator [Massilia arenosa]|uniref:MarR family transcriptional regulator n=2 Tax=Zemynaea arenosa TaxID=2561931 RepID=A0A4Y9S9U0_9BURK|nr:MarR family transcriptional regulator [Massilia arenosa]